MVALGAALALPGCDRDAPPTPAQSTSPLEGAPSIPVAGPERTVLAFGDSLLAGHGLGERESYPAKLEAALRLRGINARVVNAGVSGETTELALRRLSDTLDEQPAKPEVAVISLGGNDMLAGLPAAEARANLSRILNLLEERGIRVVLLGMLAAPDLSADYARDFNPIYFRLAQSHDAVLVPFYLQPLPDESGLTRSDGLHVSGHGVEEVVAATVDDVAAALRDPSGDAN